MVARKYDAQSASWTEEGSVDAVIEAISGRVKLGHVVDQNETGITVRYGSRTMFRLMGGIFTPRWSPLTAQVTVTAQDHHAAVDVIAVDEKGTYLGDVSMRHGEVSIGERAFLNQFRTACLELGAPIGALPAT